MIICSGFVDVISVCVFAHSMGVYFSVRPVPRTTHNILTMESYARSLWMLILRPPVLVCIIYS